MQTNLKKKLQAENDIWAEQSENITFKGKRKKNLKWLTKRRRWIWPKKLVIDEYGLLIDTSKNLVGKIYDSGLYTESWLSQLTPNKTGKVIVYTSRSPKSLLWVSTKSNSLHNLQCWRRMSWHYRNVM